MSALPRPPIEVPAQSTLTLLAPKFRAKVERVLEDMRAWGYNPRVLETWRTDERQAFLYGFGREYDDGRGRVTNAETAADSWHAYGLAVDIIDAVRQWNAAPDFWMVLGCSARRHGLVWGGDWNGNGSSDDEKLVDRPHIQWGNGMRRSPSANAIAIRATKGGSAVWPLVGAA